MKKKKERKKELPLATHFKEGTSKNMYIQDKGKMSQMTSIWYILYEVQKQAKLNNIAQRYIDRVKITKEKQGNVLYKMQDMVFSMGRKMDMIWES